MKRSAFTIIELIIAIVIIGIAVMTLPMMMQSSNRADEFAINQDMFFKSMTTMNDIRSKYWDATIANRDGDGNGSLIVGVPNGDTALKRVTVGSNYRVGSFLRGTDDMRKFYEYNLSGNPEGAETNASTIVSNALLTEVNSTEQYNGRSWTDSQTGTRISFDISVAYVSDTKDTALSNGNYERYTWDLKAAGSVSAASSTNLKKVTITATRDFSGATTSIPFVYYSSNIGTQELKSK